MGEKIQEHLSLMLEGKPIVFATDCKLVTKEFKVDCVDSDALAKSWDITCETSVECDDIVMNILGEAPKYDVVMEFPLGKLPRKMKKAYKVTQFNKNTKWQRKILAYLETRKKEFKDVTFDFSHSRDYTNITMTL